MRFRTILWIAASLLVLSCRGAHEGNLTGPPDGSHCPGEAPAWCDETCVDTLSAPAHCGACGAACEAAPHSKNELCLAGACTVDACEEGFADCDETYENGCEAELATAKEHCGGCGIACATECSAGVCDDPIEVSAGPAYTCALRATGSVWCWGNNKWGTLGVGGPESIPVPMPTKVNLPGNAVAVRTGKLASRTHACALLEGGAVHCWGANGNGQLGTGNTMGTSSPLQVDLPESSGLAVGGVHTCAVSKQHELRCWGGNADGQLGLGKEVSQQMLPALVLNNVSEVAAGGNHTCARMVDTTVACWGQNEAGQVGNGFLESAYTPAFVPALADADALGLGGAHSCALFKDGSMKCWGAGGLGQLGLNDSLNRQVPEPLSLRGVGFMSLGVASSAALIDGTLWAWGGNDQAQLGTGDTEPAWLPRLTKIGPVKRVSLGGQHGCAIRSDGELTCWGANESGQLGSGGFEPSASPVPVVFPAEVQ